MFLVFSKKEASAYIKSVSEISNTLPFLKEKKANSGEGLRENAHVKFGHYKDGVLTPVELSKAKEAIRWAEEDEKFYFEISEEFSLECISFSKKLNKIAFSLGYALMGLKTLFASSIENIEEEWSGVMSRFFPMKEEAKKEQDTVEKQEDDEHSYGEHIDRALDNFFSPE